MPTCLANKIDSNVTGLRFAEEDCLGQLPVVPVWEPMEPNSYSDFGGEVTTIARTPINPSRQRKKGVVTDVDASAGLNQDLTQTNIQKLIQGYMFADIRSKGSTNFPTPRTQTVTVDAAGLFTLAGHGMHRGAGPYEFTNSGGALPSGMAALTPYWILPVSVNTFRIATSYANAIAETTISPVGPGTGTHTVTTGNSVIPTGYRTNNPAGFSVGDLVLASGFTVAGNNGRRTVSAVTGNLVAAGTTANEVGNANQKLSVIGRIGAAADLRIDVTAARPRLLSTALDFTTLGLIAGEWIFIGGDDVNSAFANAANNGFKRIYSVSANALTLDKSELPMVADLGTGMSIQLFFAHSIKNETGSLIKRRSYQLERTLGSLDGLDPPQSEYVVGSVPSELTLNMATADKLLVDMTFVALDSEQRTQVQGLKPGIRPDLVESDAFNTSTTMQRMNMSLAGTEDEAPAPLFGFAVEASITINNTLSTNKALGRIGAFEITAGTFAVSGNLEAYFSDISAVSAVRQNADITMDAIFVQANAGLVVDVPLITLGDGRLNVELDQAIMLPLSVEAGASKKVNPNTDHTLLFSFFDYLPNLASL